MCVNNLGEDFSKSFFYIRTYIISSPLSGITSEAAAFSPYSAHKTSLTNLQRVLFDTFRERLWLVSDTFDK